jgi:hypothetical protein
VATRGLLVESVSGIYNSGAYLPSTFSRFVFFFSILIIKKKAMPAMNKGPQRGSNVILLYTMESPIISKTKKAVIIPDRP